MALVFPTGSDTLAPGRHAVSLAEIETALVDAFPGSVTRRPLFESWKAVREAITRVIAVEAEWVNGSYVTKKESPNDVDIVTHFRGSDLSALDAADGALLKGLVSANFSQLLHGCDSYVIVTYPPGHPGHALSERALQYWDKWFGHDRSGDPKGYVEVSG